MQRSRHSRRKYVVGRSQSVSQSSLHRFFGFLCCCCCCYCSIIINVALLLSRLSCPRKMKTTLLLIVSLLTIGFVVGNQQDKGCGNNPADLVLVLDESGSIWGPHFTQQLDFAQSIVSSFDVGFNRTHVGVLTFGTDNRVIFPLGKYTEEDELKERIKAITQARGETYTHLALKRLREEMFSRQYSRPWVRHVAIVITDGESNYPAETEKEARLCHQENIQMIAIGVGTAVAHKELEAIASAPDLVFTVDNYAALESLRLILAWKACEQLSTDPPPQMIEDCQGHRVMDHIWSISDQAGFEETNLAIDFIQSLTEDMKIDPLHVQVGVTEKICEEGKEIRLKDHDTGTGFRADLNRRRLVGLRTDETIKYIRTMGHSASYGGRSEAVKFGILIVDNRFEDWEKTLAEAKRARNEGVRLLIIGVGPRVDADQLKQLVSTDTDYLSINSYAELADLKNQLIQKICQGISGAQLNPRDYIKRFFY